MDANKKFEIKARIFYKMTGVIAPGKDDMMGMDYKTRLTIWEDWNSKNIGILNAMFDTLDYFEVA